jgi:hypothetical protein
MAKLTILWPGKSGKEYKYWIHPIGTDLEDSPGNYIFAKKISPRRWSPIYIGQTNNLNDHLANHEKEALARKKGATHIHAHTSDTENQRLEEEKDLVSRWKPPGNEQPV